MAAVRSQWSFVARGGGGPSGRHHTLRGYTAGYCDRNRVNARQGPKETPHAQEPDWAGCPTQPVVWAARALRRTLGWLSWGGGPLELDRAISSQTAPICSTPVDSDRLVSGPPLAMTPVHHYLNVAAALKHPTEPLCEGGLGWWHDDMDLPILCVKALGISRGKDNGHRHGTHRH
jgi:hypothetical protein